MNHPAACQDEIRALGERIFELAGDESPSIFDSRWWSGKLLEWCIRDEEFKTAMFRFIDVFPMLRGTQEISRHIEEYFPPDPDLPAPLRWGLKAATAGPITARAAVAAVHKNIEAMAARFIAGRSPDDALPLLRDLWEDGAAFSVDLLGETTLSRAEAERYRQRYLELFDVLAPATLQWPARPRLEQSPWGSVPRVNVSVKVSALHEHIDVADFDGSVERVAEALVPIFHKALSCGAFVNLDVEQYALKDITYAAFRRVLEDASLVDFAHAGIVCQAYLRDALHDLEELASWARARARPITVRLVKGAYWDFEVVRARQEGHDCPVFTDKAATDASFERCVLALIENRDVLRPAIGTHNVRSLAAAMTYARRAGLGDDALEIQMLYGMAEPLKRAAAKLGYRLREYVPIGDLVPGMAYLVRRLLENTSNESFLRASFIEHVDRDALLAPPNGFATRPDGQGILGAYERAAGDGHETRAGTSGERTTSAVAERSETFRNEPHRDFTRADVRERFTRAVAEVGARVRAGPERIPLWIDGEELFTKTTDASRDPAEPACIVAEASRGMAAEADRAAEAARRAFPGWRDTAVEQRADVLRRAAMWLREKRDDIAALEIYEVGKPWREADADVCEAIDFLEYYAGEALRIARPRRVGDVPGERNELIYEGRGVAVVIAPWNFPLAILTGMTAAALVAGNAVIVKPSEKSPAVAWRTIAALRAAGVPRGVVNFLPGPGEVVGARLVDHRDVSLTAFTGSMDVGLSIVERAARTRPERREVKRVIAEMGGKNAIIIDDDADLDEAVQGVVLSAFGYAGQKCSACSRAVVLPSIHDEFVARLVEAVRSLCIGAPRDPATQLGPVVDKRQYDCIQRWQAVAREEGKVVLECSAPSAGWFIGPMIAADVTPRARIANEEIFGPILAVMRARDFDDALAIANEARYGLTGGIYSRSPRHIERAERELRIGNLYVNRAITGALVGRQPFGGLKMSGVGSKAGGPDYLLQFMEPRTITENTVRRGFAPDL